MADKSAIQEVRDQLFLDRADGRYLSRVSANLGFPRPQLGFSDDSRWRAIVRRCAVDYRQIANIFEDILTVWFGPRNTVATVLAADASIGDTEITIQDATRIPQRGTLVIDEGLTTEETIEYSFRNPKSGLVELDTALTYNHFFPSQNYTNYLFEDEAAATTVLQLEETEFFPSTGVLLIAAGTITEEVAELIGNNTTLKQLTISSGLTYGQKGPTPSPVASSFSSFQSSQQVIYIDDSSNFPEEGLINIQEDNVAGSPSETIKYLDNDIETGRLTLATKLTGSYSTATVTLMNIGATVSLAQIQVKSAGWDIFETEQNVLKLYIPTTLSENSLLDASFLHETITTISGSPTLSAAASIGDTTISLSDASEFPDGGAIDINSGAETIGYNRIDRFEATITEDTLVGATVLYVDQVKSFVDAEDLTKDLIISYGVGTEETIAWDSIDEETNKITLTTATSNAHASGDIINLSSPDVIHLSRPLEVAHLSGVGVAMFEDAYSGTDLAIGDPNVSSNTEKNFQGPYIYNLSERAPEIDRTTLADNLPGPTSLVMTQIPGNSALEVDDASLFDTTGTFDVKVHKGVSEGETLDVTTVETRRGMTGVTINAPVSPGDTVITLNSTASPFPNASGFRILVDKGTSEEEVLWVDRILSGTTIRVNPAATKSHIATDTVELLADVIVLSESLAYEHIGKILWEQRFNTIFTDFNLYSRINLVEELRDYIDVTSAANLTANGGYVTINHGREKVIVESRLATDYAATATSLVLEDTSDFPTTYPYYVEVGSGIGKATNGDYGVEYLVVTNNNGTDTLTVGATRFAHAKFEWVKYDTGDAETISYSSTTTGTDERINFDTPITLKQKHMILENVVLSNNLSEPSKDGFDYPFYLPSSWAERLKWLFDRVRAAGIQVIVINEK
jgi:hypothetical protein